MRGHYRARFFVAALRGGAVGRVLKSQTGNVLPLVAAAMIPLMAMIGSGVDISRAYMLKTRLQQACDAGALAGRRVMTGSLLDEESITTGDNFFKSNLKNGDFGAEQVSFELTDVLDGSTPTGKVHGQASAVVPTAVMKLFGKDSIALATECEAQLNVTNNDIMFVLDVTGSMAGEPIEGLREAVSGFFATVNNATSGTARLRVGFVPYSSGINVGRLLQPIGALRTGVYSYQSRENDPANSTMTTKSLGNKDANSLTQQECDVWANAEPTVSGNSNDVVKVTSYAFVRWVKASRGTKGTCTRALTEVSYTWQWDHKQRSFDVTNFVSNADGVEDPTKFLGARSVWDGCIEERLEGAHDINLAADTDTRRWAPAWGSVSYLRSNATKNDYDNSDSYSRRRFANSNEYSCPKAATRLAVMTQDEVDAYVSEDEGFLPHGYTYHDLGMVWAARLMSTQGLFAADHGDAPNRKPVLRHIVFMTDGDMNVVSNAYTPFGIESLDKRMTNDPALASVSGLDAKHTARYLAACAAARANNISIWVVAFNTSLENQPHLTTCASPGQAFEASGSEELNEKFQYIASQIAELRLSE